MSTVSIQSQALGMPDKIRMCRHLSIQLVSVVLVPIMVVLYFLLFKPFRRAFVPIFCPAVRAHRVFVPLFVGCSRALYGTFSVTLFREPPFALSPLPSHHECKGDLTENVYKTYCKN